MTSASPGKTVPLIADLGPAGIINVGTCHPGQARILTKKGYAAWQDGKLSLTLRQVHLAVAHNHRRLEEDSHQVSEAELDRRIAWLQKILEAVVNTDTHGSDLDKITGASSATHSKGVPATPASGIEHIQRVMEQTALAKGADRFRLTFSDLKEGEALTPPPDLTPEEVDEWYNDSRPCPTDTIDAERLWHREADPMDGRLFTRYPDIYDSRKSPIRTEEAPAYHPPTYDKLTEIMGPALADVLGPRAYVVGEEPDPATVEFIGEPLDLKTLPVRFTFNNRRSPHARWPSDFPGWPWEPPVPPDQAGEE